MIRNSVQRTRVAPNRWQSRLKLGVGIADSGCSEPFMPKRGRRKPAKVQARKDRGIELRLEALAERAAQRTAQSLSARPKSLCTGPKSKALNLSARQKSSVASLTAARKRLEELQKKHELSAENGAASWSWRRSKDGGSYESNVNSPAAASSSASRTDASHAADVATKSDRSAADARGRSSSSSIKRPASATAVDGNRPGKRTQGTSTDALYQ